MGRARRDGGTQARRRAAALVFAVVMALGVNLVSAGALGNTPPTPPTTKPTTPSTTPTTPSTEPTTTSETTQVTAPPPTAAPTTIRRTTTTVRTAATAAAVTEPPTTATTVITPATNLLVPGDGSDGSQSTTTTIAVADTSGISESTKVTAIVAGLIAIALMVAILTARYWRMTKPVPLTDAAALDVLDDTGDDVGAEPVEPPGPDLDTAASSPVPSSIPSVDDATAPGRSVFADPR